MDYNLVLALAAVATLTLALLFGSQYGGIVPWLRDRRRRRKASTSVSETADAQPAQAVQPYEEENVRISRALAQRNQPRAARWAYALPLILSSFSRLGWVVGLLTCLLGAYLEAASDAVGKQIIVVGLWVIIAGTFFYFLADWAVIIVRYVADIAMYIKYLLS